MLQCKNNGVRLILDLTYIRKEICVQYWYLGQPTDAFCKDPVQNTLLQVSVFY